MSVRGKLSFWKQIHTFDSLAIRDYRLLWMGLGSSSGQWMDQVTRGWLIYQLTGSALQLGLATATRGLPTLLFGIVTGALADRSNRKAQLVIAQASNVALNFLLATLVVTGKVQPWHIYATGFLAGSVQAFQQPARQTIIVDIVGRQNLLNALALNSTVVNISRSMGPSLAGIIIAFWGTGGSYFVQGFIYIFAVMWTIQMNIPKRSEEFKREREPFFKSIGSGLAYVTTQPNIRTLMIIGLGPLVLGMPYASLMPIFATEVLDGGPKLQGLLLTCVGIGALIGAITVASVKRKHGYGLPVAIGGMLFGGVLMAFSMSEWVPLSIFLAVCIGLSNSVYQTQNQTLLQLLAPGHLRGRVMSIFHLDRGLVPLGSLMIGILASWLGGQYALLIMAGCAVVLVASVTLLTPSFRTLKVSFDEGAVAAHGRGRRDRERDPELAKASVASTDDD